MNTIIYLHVNIKFTYYIKFLRKKICYKNTLLWYTSQFRQKRGPCRFSNHRRHFNFRPCIFTVDSDRSIVGVVHVCYVHISFRSV